jgi:hypothetical protein
MDIKLVDVIVHVDESIAADRRSALESGLRGMHGVVSVHMPEDKPHLVTVEYNPDAVTSQQVLRCVTEQGVHAELVGL